LYTKPLRGSDHRLPDILSTELSVGAAVHYAPWNAYRSVIVSNESILMVVVIGGVAGWLAGLILRGTGYGIIGDIIVGLIGAFIGNWLVRAFHFSVNLGSPVADRIVVSVVGAVLLMPVIGMLRPRSLRERFTNVWRR
jgi:uncharacterized membrane protein YeaQ/YmgE (transglycosylase-associated protein family)